MSFEGDDVLVMGDGRCEMLGNCLVVLVADGGQVQPLSFGDDVVLVMTDDDRSLGLEWAGREGR